MVALCGPCKNGKKGTANVTKAQLASIKAGKTYVNIHTAKNAAGEIRGQVKAKKGPSTGGSPPPLRRLLRRRPAMTRRRIRIRKSLGFEQQPRDGCMRGVEAGGLLEAPRDRVCDCPAAYALAIELEIGREAVEPAP